MVEGLALKNPKTQSPRLSAPSLIQSPASAGMRKDAKATSSGSPGKRPLLVKDCLAREERLRAFRV